MGIIKYLSIFVMIAVAGTPIQGGESTRAIPEKIIGYLATSSIEKLDSECLAFLQAANGFESRKSVLPDIEQIPDMGQIPPISEIALGGFFDLPIFRVNPKGVIRAIVIEDEKGMGLSVALQLPLYPFGNLIREMEKGQERIHRVDGQTDLLRVDPGANSLMATSWYMTPLGVGNIVAADNPSVIKAAKAAFEHAALAGPLTKEGFGINVWFDMSNPLGEWLFASMAASTSRDMMMAGGSQTATMQTHVFLSFLRLAAQSVSVNAAVRLHDGTIESKVSFAPRAETTLALSLSEMHGLPTRSSKYALASLPEDTAAFIAMEGNPATAKILTNYLKITEFYSDNIHRRLITDSFMRRVLGDKEGTFVTAGATVEGEGFICVTPASPEMADSIARDLQNVDGTVAMASDKTQLVSYFHPTTERNPALDIQAMEQGQIRLGARVGLPRNFIAPEAKLIAACAVFLPDLMAPAFSGKGIFASGKRDDNMFGAWFHRKMRDALEEYKVESRYPITTLIGLEGDELTFSTSASLGVFKEMVDLYQRMAGGMTPYGQVKKGAALPESFSQSLNQRTWHLH